MPVGAPEAALATKGRDPRLCTDASAREHENRASALEQGSGLRELLRHLPRTTAHASENQPARNATPPSGVTAPSHRAPVKESK